MLSKDCDNTWHQVTAFKNDRMPDLESLDKGVAVEVKGRIRNQRYTDANGVEKQMSEIIASQLKVLDGPLQMSVEE